MFIVMVAETRHATRRSVEVYLVRGGSDGVESSWMGDDEASQRKDTFGELQCHSLACKDLFTGETLSNNRTGAPDCGPLLTCISSERQSIVNIARLDLLSKWYASAIVTMGTLSWKDVLRPIRDGYRHLFPSPDSGPTPEERRRRRASDQLLKGFTYFDTVDQLHSWTSAGSDVLQRANTPLLRRSPVAEIGDVKKANVLLCHDYSGNYQDYEASHSVGVDEEYYSCEYLQFVDVFVYFSHKLACVPPPSWTNTLHRNGVKVLGTFLVEPQTKDTERLLEHDALSYTFPAAQKLADIAQHYGFDGWLVNLEKPFPAQSWDYLVLQAFLQQLKTQLGEDRQLLWSVLLDFCYDLHYVLRNENLRARQRSGPEIRPKTVLLHRFVVTSATLLLP